MCSYDFSRDVELAPGSVSSYVVRALNDVGADLPHAMIVTVRAMRMVQMIIHKVIDVFAMRHCLVGATHAVDVSLVVSGTVVARRAVFRIRRANLNFMIVHMIAMGVMQVAIVKIVGVAVVFHGRMATVWAMLVGVGTGVLLMIFSHGLVLS